jgi:hypothetical protein
MLVVFKNSVKTSPRITLSDNLDIPSFRILVENGLSQRGGKLLEEWNGQRNIDKSKLDSDRRAELSKKLAEVKEAVEFLKLRMPSALVKMTINYFPYAVIFQYFSLFHLSLATCRMIKMACWSQCWGNK